MKNAIILLLVTIGASASAQTTAKPSKTMLVTAELTNEPGWIFYCGIMLCNINLTFDTHKSFSKGIKINATVECPLETYGEGFFVKGKHYLLTVDRYDPKINRHMPDTAEYRPGYVLKKALKLD